MSTKNKILRMFGWFIKSKKYGHIISLGYNCEVSFQFFKKYHFVESSLFACANTKSCRNLINALKHMDLITSKGVCDEGAMFRDIASDINFHAKDQKCGLKSEESVEQELLSRLSHLKEKFAKTASDGKKNLYVFKYPPQKVSYDCMKKDIVDLYETLGNIVKNEFDLLIILEKDTYPQLAFDIDNLFVRRVKFFTPEDRVTSKPYDKSGWRKIFSEFRPDFKLPSTKHFKFEEK